MNKDLIYRILAMVLGIACPLIMISWFPEVKSLSGFFETEAVPLFIVMNIVTAYFFYLLPNWKISGVLLFLVTAVPLHYYKHLHDILAVLFFISCIFAVWKSNRYRFLIFPFMISISIIPFSLLWAEISGIYSICIFHTLMVWERNRLQKEKKEIESIIEDI